MSGGGQNVIGPCPMQLVVPSAVSAADMMLAIICKMVFQVSFFIVRVCVVVTTYCPPILSCRTLIHHVVMSSAHPFFVERLPSICHVEGSRDISRPLGRLAKPKYLLRRFKRSLHSLRSVEMTTIVYLNRKINIRKILRDRIGACSESACV